MNFNLKCDRFKRDLVNYINNTDLPIAVIYYICQNVFEQIEKVYIGAVNQAVLQESKQAVQTTKQQQQEEKQEQVLKENN